ncbi:MULTISPECIES: hypothetical protein [Spirulina sp. CCY15215]|uniref:hypothetical protein n=1 Tax=Spirulina sp. CCY15215 TaxID=2767591 RepID=UPI00194DBC2A|nr:hypothetical protein [Spirulina major]
MFIANWIKEKNKDGKIRYVKYRLILGDRGIDSGVISGEDWQKPWLQKRRPDETRPIDYRCNSRFENQ